MGLICKILFVWSATKIYLIKFFVISKKKIFVKKEHYFSN